ncbi:multicopper oxidase domain-containing protein [Agromyces lapidis]|uniref:Multicopper oxidase domain-containing protein n=1 Tax=Agromyces lapidis TaxID=279574 RepID=A0ABV5SY32_9MICO|nr:multicopper oxidase domain-containing protein [Agromyces lapidis]
MNTINVVNGFGVIGKRVADARGTAKPIEAPRSQAETASATIVNDTDMWHSRHLHGHTFQHAGGGRGRIPPSSGLAASWRPI